MCVYPKLLFGPWRVLLCYPTFDLQRQKQPVIMCLFSKDLVFPGAAKTDPVDNHG